MDEQRRQKIEELFEQALELEPEQRAAFLEKACAGDDELLAEVQSLLDAEENLPDFLEAPLVVEQSINNWQDKNIGPFRVIRELGRGGMGMVFLAERVGAGFEQKVALKLVQPEIGKTNLHERFESERRILARLQHPHIARLYDGGISEDGIPYFAMEYIEGRPLDVYCDEMKLSLRKRLELFLDVCEAMQYAHNNLVIHRDLKPSNILVTEEGRVKVLDFGIAKIVEDSELPDVEITMAGQRFITPAYASPEQIAYEPVSTASDVYSLGMILYRLLSGLTAYEITTHSPIELQRQLESQKIERPSRRLRQSGETLQDDISRNRRLSPGALYRQLKGDLDHIVLKCLHKQPARRYGQVSHLAADIRRYLGGRPISARPESPFYIASRFVARNRKVLTAAVLVVLFSVLQLYFYTQNLRREKEKAEQVAGLLTRVFEAADPENSKGEDITARELLQAGTAKVRNTLSGQPDIKAHMLRLLGKINLNLGAFSSADSLFEQALALYRENNLPRDSLYARILVYSAETAVLKDQFARADSLLGEADAVLEKLLPEAYDLFITANNYRAFLNNTRGDFKKAESLYWNSVHYLKEHYGEEDSWLGTTYNNLGLVYHNAGNHPKADSLYRLAIKVQEASLGPVHTELADSYYNFAQVARDMGNYALSESLFTKVLEMDRTLYGDNHINISYTLNGIGNLQVKQNKLQQAEKNFREALRIRVATHGLDHSNVGYCWRNLGHVKRAKAQYDSAAHYYNLALQNLQTSLGPEHADVARIYRNLGGLFRETGNKNLARQYYNQSLTVFLKSFPEEHRLVRELKEQMAE